MKKTNKEKVDPFDVMIMNHAVTIGIVEAVDLGFLMAYAFADGGATPKAVRQVLAELDNAALVYHMTDRRAEWIEARAQAADGKRKRNSGAEGAKFVDQIIIRGRR
tara:strand:- start:233 stop:550 length:318 start_codon:yes stop_codon:yes gene_type:complete